MVHAVLEQRQVTRRKVQNMATKVEFLLYSTAGIVFCD